MALRLLQRVQRASASRSAAAFSTGGGRVFPNFTAYGSDSAFQVSPNMPIYTTAQSGNYLKTKRAGSIMLSWAKATNSGYNYQNKAFFSLSGSEVGLLLELLDARMSELSLTHSPNVNAGEEDKAKRVLSIARTSGADGLPAIVFKFAGEFQAGAAINAGEARALRGPLTIEGAPGPSGGNGPSGYSSNRSPSGGAKPAAEWPF
ncbi:hypothetical protein PybrP1_011692 [[Pythium] brassicae (nom. inval.)]|nr:hypothetical protein PybrP1_011692 [[Pythium] brassicae (nom. inval.)]